MILNEDTIKVGMILRTRLETEWFHGEVRLNKLVIVINKEYCDMCKRIHFDIKYLDGIDDLVTDVDYAAFAKVNTLWYQ